MAIKQHDMPDTIYSMIDARALTEEEGRDFQTLLVRVQKYDEDLANELENCVNFAHGRVMEAAFEFGFETARCPDPAIFFTEAN